MDILVADDGAVDRQLVSKLAERVMGATVREAVDGAQALNMIAEQEPDLVLADINMPIINGIGLVDSLKASHPRVPVILMSGVGNEDLAAESLTHGAAAYVPKRHLARDLNAVVQRTLALWQTGPGYGGRIPGLLDASYSATLAPTLACIRPVMIRMGESMGAFKLFSDEDRARVGSAAIAAMHNSILHGCLEAKEIKEACGADEVMLQTRLSQRAEMPPYCDRRVKMSVELNLTQAVFCLEDNGPGFDVDAELSKLKESDAQGTRGLQLIHAVMDEVQFNDKGNTITLTKKRTLPFNE